MIFFEQMRMYSVLDKQIKKKSIIMDYLRIEQQVTLNRQRSLRIELKTYLSKRKQFEPLDQFQRVDHAFIIISMSEEHNLTEMLSVNYQRQLKVPDHFLCPEKDMIQQDIQDDDIYQSSSQTYPVNVRFISNDNSDQNQFDGTTINNFVQNRDDSGEIFQSDKKNIQDDMLPSLQEQNPLTTTLTTKFSKQKGRQDDSNNFFKKYITIVSKCLPSKKKQKLSKIIRLLNSIEKLNTKKSSRQGFSCLLLNIRYILGKKTLLKVYSNYRKINPYQFLEFKNEKAKAYFERTRPAYSLAWKSFLKLKLVSCVKYTYLMTSSFKQRTYRKQGIKYAKCYKQQLKRLLSKVKAIKKTKK